MIQRQTCSYTHQELVYHKIISLQNFMVTLVQWWKSSCIFLSNIRNQNQIFFVQWRDDVFQYKQFCLWYNFASSSTSWLYHLCMLFCILCSVIESIDFLWETFEYWCCNNGVPFNIINFLISFIFNKSNHNKSTIFVKFRQTFLLLISLLQLDFKKFHHSYSPFARWFFFLCPSTICMMNFWEYKTIYFQSSLSSH